MDDPLLLQFLLQLILIGLNAFFACAEIAVISVNETRLEKLSEQGDRKARKLLKLTRRPDRFLATIQVAITLSGFLGSAFAADNFSERLVDFIYNGLGFIALPMETLDVICVVLITLLLSFLTLVFGELVPKRLAMKNSEKLALTMSAALVFFSRLFAPVAWLLSISTNGVLRLLGIDPNAEEESDTEEDILLMIDAGAENGVIDEEEKQLLQNVFEFDDVSAADVATHRTRVEMLMMEDSDEVWQETIFASRHSRLPVCGESVDDIIGILNAKAYFRLSDKSRGNVMANAVFEPHFIPDSVKADVLFADMKQRRNHFAVVLDEYGGVHGIVTLNDLLQEIVGNIFQDDDDTPPPIEQTGENTWHIRGSVDLKDLADVLDMPDLPMDEFDTLGGLAVSTLDSYPEDGEQFECTVAGLHIKVLRIEERCVEEAVITRLPTPKEEDEAEDE